MKKIVLITSGGTGERAKSDLPKQFVEICGKPVLFYSFYTFLKYSSEIEFILVLHRDYIEQWDKICKKHKFIINHKIVEGGPTRFHSVKNGLKYVDNDALVAIHDAARPLVSLETISSGFNYANRFGNAIPAIEIFDSVREVKQAQNFPVDRHKLRIIQTPQCFLSNLIKEAYNQNYNEIFTDDASVLESKGHKIFLTQGNAENIKITNPIDFLFAESILSKYKK